MGNEFSIGQEIQLFSLEQTMTSQTKKICCRIALFGMCILISGWLAAQTDTAKKTGQHQVGRAHGRCGCEDQRERRPCT